MSAARAVFKVVRGEGRVKALTSICPPISSKALAFEVPWNRLRTWRSSIPETVALIRDGTLRSSVSPHIEPWCTAARLNRDGDPMISLRNPSFRQMAAVIAAVGTLFWLYTFYAIDHVPQGDGSGFQWLAAFSTWRHPCDFLPAGVVAGRDRPLAALDNCDGNNRADRLCGGLDSIAGGISQEIVP